jgi:putative heme-binding domain-containing protein
VLAPKVTELARGESSVFVRSQLASSARRLPAAEGLPIVQALLQHDEDAGDIHVPLLLWWAIEAKCANDRAAVLDLFRESNLWRTRIAEETILSRLMKRFALAGAQKDYRTCTELFRLAPERKHGEILLKGFEEAFKGRSIAGLPRELLDEIAKLGGGSVAFGVRQGKAEAVAKALAAVENPKTPVPQRVELIELFGEANQPKSVPTLLAALAPQEPAPVRKAALGALQAYNDRRIGADVVKLLPQLKDELRERAESLLVSRSEWSGQLLDAVDQKRIDLKSLPLATVRKLLLHRDAKIQSLVRKHWGEVKGATTEQMRKEVDRLVGVVGGGTGSPYVGKKLFTTRCATCHVLHAHGNTVGPDLTPFKRDDAAGLLIHIVNPSAEIREGYETSVVNTESGRTLTGIVVEKDTQVIVLRTADGQRVVLPRDDVAEMAGSGISLMPEGLLRDLSDQDVRDLFAYLRSSQPLNERK